VRPNPPRRLAVSDGLENFMRRFRIATAVFAAYTLVVASVLGAVTSASATGSTHLQQCITSAADGKPLPPAHAGKDGLCCFVGSGAHAPALLPEPLQLSVPQEFSFVELPFSQFAGLAATTGHFANPRAPPARA
jgi:hypothetical protein